MQNFCKSVMAKELRQCYVKLCAFKKTWIGNNIWELWVKNLICYKIKGTFFQKILNRISFILNLFSTINQNWISFTLFFCITDLKKNPELHSHTTKKSGMNCQKLIWDQFQYLNPPLSIFAPITIFNLRCKII